jgi:hypothetical protein
MAEETIDPGLLEQTKNQIRKLVSEIAELAESDIQPPEFHVEFLNRVVAAVAATGGALWMLDQRNTLKLVHQLEFRQTGLLDNRQRAAPHEALLGVMLQASQPQIIPPGAAVEGMPNAGNPTPLTLILAPITVDKKVVGLVEILMDPNRRAATQKSTLRFVSDLCDLAAQYLKNRQVRQMMSQQRLWNQLEGYTHAIHQSLDLRETCYAVANDGKRLAGCDRLSVTLKLAGKTRVEAVSGQEVVEQRANLIRELTRLCKVVIASGEDLVYTGNTEGFPPEIRDALEIYVDESGSKAVVVTLLHRPEGEEKKEKVPFGCLVAEQIGDEMAPTDMHARCEVLSRHASTALWNAQEHDKIALRPVLKAIGHPRRLLRGRTLAKILAVVGLVLGVILAMAFVPWKLTVEGRGSVLPEIRHNTYAPLAGIVVETPHEHGDLVRGPHLDAEGRPVPGELLAKLESDELKGRLTELIARQAEAEKQVATLTSQINRLSTSKSDERAQLIGERVQAEIKRDSAKKQIEIIEDQYAKMEVRAPHDGIVTTWEVKKNFRNRPVDMGQELIQVASVDGEWTLEVNVPDHDMGPILESKGRLEKMMQPVEDAKAKLDQAAQAGVTKENSEAVLAAQKAVADALRSAEKAGARDLINLDEANEAVERFGRILARLGIGEGVEAGEVADAKAALDGAIDRATTLSCYFVSAADPEHKYPGHVKRIGSKAETVEQNHVVKVTVGFSEAVKQDYLARNRTLRPGAEVRARINCGDASMAYALLRDVVQFWHETVMFRWPFLK